MSFLSKICAKYEIHATEDWPYFHVTDFTDTPNAPNLYLGIKGKKYSTSSYAWDRMKYFWNAQLKPNLKLYKPKEDWIQHFFMRNGFCHGDLNEIKKWLRHRKGN